MSRNLSDLQKECADLGLEPDMTGCKRASKERYEVTLRDHYWNRDHNGEELPEQIEPMLARNSKDLPKEELDSMLADVSDWVGQEKINGCRCTIRFRHGKTNHLLSRNLSDETYRMNELHDQMPHYRDLELGAEWHDTVIDGEVMSSVAVVDTSIVDGKGVKTLDILQATAAIMNSGVEKSVALQKAFGKLIFHAFDILRFQGRDVRELPYVVLNAQGDLDDDAECRYNLLSRVVAHVFITDPTLDYSKHVVELPKHVEQEEIEPQVVQENVFDELLG